MLRTDDDIDFIKEEAGWLPLEKSIVTVKECLLHFISSLATATDYLRGESNDRPKERMSDLFAIVCNNKCDAFEDLCNRIRECGPGLIPERTIPGEMIERILRLGTILVGRAEDVLPSDDLSSNDLRNAMTSLFALTRNTSRNLSIEGYEAKVDATRKDIHQGFKSLSNGFRKMEIKRERGEDPSNGMLKEADKVYIASVGKEVSATVEIAAAELNERADIQADRIKGVEHEVKLARKGQIFSCKGFSEDRQKAAFNYWVASRAEYGAKHISDVGFTFYAKSLKDIGIETPEVWHTVVEQWRCKKHLSITKAVKAYNKEQTKTTIRK